MIVAFTHLFTGDTTQAILECNKILSDEARPNIGVFLLKGWSHLRQGDFQNAVYDLSRFIDETEVSDGLDALRGLAYHLRATGYENQEKWILCLSDLKKGIDLYEADADVDPDDLAELCDQLRDQQIRVERKQAGESNDSDGLPESAVPLSKPPRHEVLEALVAGDLEGALERCEEHLDEDDDDINIRFLRGMAKDLRGRRRWKDDENKQAAETDFSDAIAEYSKVIEDTTSHFLSRAFVRRSQLQIALQEPEKALEGLNKLVSLELLNEDEPLNIHAGLSRGIAELHLYHYDEAGHAFDQVLCLDPENIRALDGNGQVDLHTQEWSAALRNFKMALAYSTERADTAQIAQFTFMVALTYYLDDKYEQAIAELHAIEPILDALQKNEQRQLRQKIDTLRGFLPEWVPDSEEAFKEQLELFRVATEEEVKCLAGFICVLYQIHNTGTRRLARH